MVSILSCGDNGGRRRRRYCRCRQVCHNFHCVCDQNKCGQMFIKGSILGSKQTSAEHMVRGNKLNLSVRMMSIVLLSRSFF